VASASFTFTAGPRYPAGTVIGAYPVRLFPGPAPQEGTVAPVPFAVSAAVSSLGFATFTGLLSGTSYYAGASVGGVWIWTSFKTAGQTPLSSEEEALARVREESEAAIRAAQKVSQEAIVASTLAAEETLAELSPGLQVAARDGKQPGVLSELDWVLSSVAINAATGKLTLETGGNAWVSSGGVLARTSTAVAVWERLPAALPAAGKWRVVGIEVAPLGGFGSNATVSVVSGTEQASAALALANSPATSVNKLRIQDLVLKNVGGVYSLEGLRDRRPWALGARASSSLTTGNVVKEGGQALTVLPMGRRVECSGLPVRLVLEAAVLSESGLATAGFRMDGVTVNGTPDGGLTPWGGNAVTAWSRTSLGYEFTPAAGSHLFVPTVAAVGSAGVAKATFVASVTQPIEFSVEELLPSANNGVL
jgi:hypothetical protein